MINFKNKMAKHFKTLQRFNTEIPDERRVPSHRKCRDVKNDIYFYSVNRKGDMRVRSASEGGNVPFRVFHVSLLLSERTSFINCVRFWIASCYLTYY